jgi:two-component system chemotaxis response regulator CheY
MSENRRTLLIVDDSLIIRQAIAKFIENFDIEIIATAHNGDTALELFRKFLPDFVTLDITMPGLGGFHVLQEMVRISKKSKIIVVTALSDKGTGLKALKMGASSYLNKPFGAQKFKTAFQRLLEDLDQ